MSPNDMVKYREEFNKAVTELGWTVKKVKVYHERDDCSWTEEVWFGPGGDRLFSESSLEEGFVKEMIRLANFTTWGPSPLEV